MADLDAIKRATAAALREGLADKGLTQTQLGDAIGYSDSAVSAWVTGQNVISVEAALAVGDVFGWPPGGLLVRAGLVEHTSVLDAIEADGALDATARAHMRQEYRKAIGDAARRRIAEIALATGGDDDTMPAEALFGPDGPHHEAASL